MSSSSSVKIVLFRALQREKQSKALIYNCTPTAWMPLRVCPWCFPWARCRFLEVRRQQETRRTWSVVCGGLFCTTEVDRSFHRLLCVFVHICVYERRIPLVIGIYNCLYQSTDPKPLSGQLRRKRKKEFILPKAWKNTWIFLSTEQSRVSLKHVSNF